MGITEQQFHFMVESITADLIQRLMERLGISLRNAIETVYCSDTYSALTQPDTGLYYQSTGYIWEYLINEIQTGQMS